MSSFTLQKFSGLFLVRPALKCVGEGSGVRWALSFAAILTASVLADSPNQSFAQSSSSSSAAAVECAATSGSVLIQHDFVQHFAISCADCDVTSITNPQVNGQSVVLAREYLPTYIGEQFFPLHSSLSALPDGSNTISFNLACADGRQATISSTVNITREALEGSGQTTSAPTTFVEESKISDQQYDEIITEVTAQMAQSATTTSPQCTPDDGASNNPPDTCTFRIGPIIIPYFEIVGEKLPGQDAFTANGTGVPPNVSLHPFAMTVEQKAAYYKNALTRATTDGEPNAQGVYNLPNLTHQVIKMFPNLPGPASATFHAKLPVSGTIGEVIPVRLTWPGVGANWNKANIGPVWFNSATRTQVVGVAVQGNKSGMTDASRAWAQPIYSEYQQFSIPVILFDFSLDKDGIGLLADGNPSSFSGLYVGLLHSIFLPLYNNAPRPGGFFIPNNSGSPSGPTFQSTIYPQGSAQTILAPLSITANTLAHEIGHAMGLDHIKNDAQGSENLMASQSSGHLLTPHQACWLRDRCFNFSQRFGATYGADQVSPHGSGSIIDPFVNDYCGNGRLAAGYFSMLPLAMSTTSVIGPPPTGVQPYPVQPIGHSTEASSFVSQDIGEQCDLVPGTIIGIANVSSYGLNCGAMNPAPGGNEVDLGKLDSAGKQLQRWGTSNATSPLACYKELPVPPIPNATFTKCQLRNTCGNQRLDTEPQVAEGCDETALQPDPTLKYDGAYCEATAAQHGITGPLPTGAVAWCGYRERDPATNVETAYFCKCGVKCVNPGEVLYKGNCNICCPNDAVGCTPPTGEQPASCTCPEGKTFDAGTNKCKNAENGSSVGAPRTPTPRPTATPTSPPTATPTPCVQP